MSRIIKNEIVIVFFLTLLAVLSRIYGLGQWEFLVDEYYTVYDAEERYHSLKTNPIYYALTLLMFNIFGVSEWTARFPAFLFGVVTIPVVYILCRNWLGRNIAFITAIIILVSSWHLWYSQFSRFYSGVFLFGFLSFYYYFKAIESGKAFYLAITFLFNVIVVLLHQSAVLVVASCLLWSVVLLIFASRLGVNGYSRKFVAIYTGVYTLIGLAALPYLIERTVGWFEKGQVWGYGSFSFVLQIVKYIQIPVAITAIFGLVLMLQRERMKGVFFLVATGTPLLLLFTASTIMSVRPDYVFYAIPLVYILSAYFCEYIRSELADNRWVANAVALLLVASMLPEAVSHYTGRKTQGLRQAVAFIESHYESGDKILPFVSGFLYYASKTYAVEKRLGSPYENKNWKDLLEKYKQHDKTVYIFLPRQRKPLDKNLENWLFNNARLVWRNFENRIDFTVRGYQIFVAGGSYGQ